MLRRDVLDDEEQMRLVDDALSARTTEEAGYLRTIVDELSRPEARDPKTTAVRYFLAQYRSDDRTWLEHGCIIFSQYFHTVCALPRSWPSHYPGTRGHLRGSRQERHLPRR
jgi:hypothetical protein